MTEGLDRQLEAAERWVVGPDGTPAFVDGWEDGYAFCATVASTDVGLAFCRRCPRPLVERVRDRRRAASDRCPAGVRLLAFPSPAGGDGIGVLRTAPPLPASAAAVADRTRIAAPVLRRAARRADPADARATLAAARRLRDPRFVVAWRVEQRERGADRGRRANAALAQMIATSEEFHDLYRDAERQRRALERSRRQVDRLARELVRSTDEERARVGHQIHDTAAQSMVSAFRFLDAARAAAEQAADAVPPVVVANLREAAERVQAAIRELRGVLSQLVPPGLDELGLAPAIRTRVEALTSGTAIRAEVRGELPRLSPGVEQTLHNLVAEAVSNAVRHADPSTIDVELGVARKRAVIVVADDGRGFDPRAVDRRTNGGGLGLLGITRQASWLGGRAVVRSRRGFGTRLTISVPIEPPSGGTR